MKRTLALVIIIVGVTAVLLVVGLKALGYPPERLALLPVQRCQDSAPMSRRRSKPSGTFCSTSRNVIGTGHSLLLSERTVARQNRNLPRNGWARMAACEHSPGWKSTTPARFMPPTPKRKCVLDWSGRRLWGQ